MTPFTILKGVAAPLMKRDVDTDVIIRIERLITVDKKDLGPYAFEAWRYLPDGSENPDFLLNRQPLPQPAALSIAIIIFQIVNAIFAGPTSNMLRLEALHGTDTGGSNFD